MRMSFLVALLAAGFAFGAAAHAQQPDPAMHNHMAGMTADTRELVVFPPPMRAHTLANMRDHLLTLSEIQAALAVGHYEKASELAEQRLGMSSLKLHGAHELSEFMPKGMQDLGTAMHRSASEFALKAQAASATGDLQPALGALSRVTQSCVACHAAYRLQ